MECLDKRIILAQVPSLQFLCCCFFPVFLYKYLSPQGTGLRRVSSLAGCGEQLSKVLLTINCMDMALMLGTNGAILVSALQCHSHGAMVKSDAGKDQGDGLPVTYVAGSWSFCCNIFSKHRLYTFQQHQSHLPMHGICSQLEYVLWQQPLFELIQIHNLSLDTYTLQLQYRAFNKGLPLQPCIQHLT